MSIAVDDWTGIPPDAEQQQQFSFDSGDNEGANIIVRDKLNRSTAEMRSGSGVAQFFLRDKTNRLAWSLF